MHTCWTTLRVVLAVSIIIEPLITIMNLWVMLWRLHTRLAKELVNLGESPQNLATAVQVSNDTAMQHCEVMEVVRGHNSRVAWWWHTLIDQRQMRLVPCQWRMGGWQNKKWCYSGIHVHTAHSCIWALREAKMWLNAMAEMMTIWWLVISLYARTCHPHCQAHGVGHLIASLCV